MTDYRKPENRPIYFDKLYAMNLEHGVMPGLVYLYLPKLCARLGLDDEQALWFALLNGLTQNPITTLAIFMELPECPPAGAALTRFTQWFNDNWANLQFDTDRVKNKRNTVAAIKSYAELVDSSGGQPDLWREGVPYGELWARARQVHSLGRLSAFSYLEYVRILGFGSDCDNLMFDDLEGSKSHRNGAFFYHGMDDFVWDKRKVDSHPGKYDNFDKICAWLEQGCGAYLRAFQHEHSHLPHVGRFTLESQFCQFKNGFFKRRYPGVYADMAWERIQWYDERGRSDLTRVFKEIREQHLPDWLRIETQHKPLPRAQRAALFADTGTPYRAEYFL